MGRLFCLTTALAISFANPAAAQWIYHANESAFGGDSTHMALTTDGSYGFGVRCHAGRLDGVFLTPEELSAAEGAAFSAIPASLMLRVDDNSPYTLDATVSSASGKLRVEANLEGTDLPDEILNAKRRLAVAMAVAGQQFHETSFNVRGSTNSMQQLQSKCKP